MMGWLRMGAVCVNFRSRLKCAKRMKMQMMKDWYGENF